MTDLQKQLFEMQDTVYKNFHARLMPTVDPDTIIGIRTPILRKFAKQFAKTEAAKYFIKTLPHKYYEENNLHAFLIEQISDFSECISALDSFLPFVDNWATCDMMTPKVFKKHLPQLDEKIKIWLKSDDTYTVRFAVKTLMSFYLDEYFDEKYLKAVAEIKSDEYYIKMVIAWFFATALAKQYEPAVRYIENHTLDTWTHNKAIQKAIESYRVTDEQKSYLRSLKVFS